MAATQFRQIALPDLQIHCKTQGSGVPVLLVHGFLGSTLSWRKQLAPLAEAGYQAIAIDLPGFGETHQDWESDHSHARYAQVCASLIEALACGPVHFIGHSMGGQVGVRLAWERPDLIRTLTVIDGAIYRTPLRALGRFPPVAGLLRRLIHRRWKEPERLRRDLVAASRVRLSVLPGEGHLPNESAPEAVNAVLLDFFRGDHPD